MFRVWIPKPGKDEKRPLGIPTIYDHALQVLVKLGMEAEWQGRFEPNSYGLFRWPTHDAIAAIYASINKKSKYVLDADISNGFYKAFWHSGVRGAWWSAVSLFFSST
ncbi:MAG: hypothetical protein F6K23_19120 [Okeania sp. SIO2C9]|uniref:reverse transcriptase domain-containing protein n=1 Tax=Okeania sp. SIO2C9 TaxID=2607791 RepID=UPI0013C28FFF|nr:hypothetical protein [Okeania sp. SIO2C9]